MPVIIIDFLLFISIDIITAACFCYHIITVACCFNEMNSFYPFGFITWWLFYFYIKKLFSVRIVAQRGPANVTPQNFSVIFFFFLVVVSMKNGVGEK